mmetsp:Transcript_3165/g.5693  ORF Transcript_3165/g.5693 Transcript_3165/m.5693 type:complete len:239 (+) Transcript_3165:378-1094(+)
MAFKSTALVGRSKRPQEQHSPMEYITVNHADHHARQWVQLQITNLFGQPSPRTVGIIPNPRKFSCSPGNVLWHLGRALQGYKPRLQNISGHQLLHDYMHLGDALLCKVIAVCDLASIRAEPHLQSTFAQRLCNTVPQLCTVSDLRQMLDSDLFAAHQSHLRHKRRLTVPLFLNAPPLLQVVLLLSYAHGQQSSPAPSGHLGSNSLAARRAATLKTTSHSCDAKGALRNLALNGTTCTA